MMIIDVGFKPDEWIVYISSRLFNKSYLGYIINVYIFDIFSTCIAWTQCIHICGSLAVGLVHQIQSLSKSPGTMCNRSELLVTW